MAFLHQSVCPSKYQRTTRNINLFFDPNQKNKNKNKKIKNREEEWS